MTAKIDPRYDHVWFWRTRLPHRKGQPRRVTIRIPDILNVGRMGDVKAVHDWLTLREFRAVNGDE